MFVLPVARLNRPGWEARWGDEEPARAGGAVSVSAPGVQGDVHPAYAGMSGGVRRDDDHRNRVLWIGRRAVTVRRLCCFPSVRARLRKG